MIDLNAMHLMLLVVFLWAGIMPFTSSWLQSNEDVEITNPINGQTLQGVVLVEGATARADGTTWDLQFGYLEDPTDTWFTLATSDQTVENGEIAAWDTTRITDGDYRLRLVIHFVDGTSQEVQVRDLQVRNYTAQESGGSVSQPNLEPSAIPGSSFITTFPTPVLDPNPGAIDSGQLIKSGLIGAGVVLVAFLTFGIYIAVRNERMRRS